MKSKLLHEEHGQREFVLVFQTGDEAMQGLQQFAREANLTAARFTAIGALSSIVLGYFDLGQKQYQSIPINEQVELLSLVGNVALHQDKPQLHAHVVVGKRDGTAHGGHLLEAHVRPTLEVILTELPKRLQRVHDEATGLALIRL